MRERWARLRFSIIGHASGGAAGEGQAARDFAAKLAACEWRHPISGGLIRFSVSTLERWLY